MKITFLKSLAFLALSLVTLSGCIKDDIVELTDQGTNFLKIMEAPVNQLYFSPFSDVKSIDLFSIRRDVVSEAALNTAQTVTVTLLPSYIDQYNEENGTHYELLPDSLYSTAISSSGNDFDFSMAPGEFAKNFTIQLDGSKWDASKVYALPAVISNAGGTTISGGADTVIALLGIVNKYDGRYRLTGFHNRDPYTFPYDTEIHLVTMGNNSVGFYWPMAGSIGHPIGVGEGELSWYGAAIAPVLVFDLETDEIIEAYNQSGGTIINLYTTADGSDALANRFDPESGDIDVSWKYGNNVLRAFFDHLEYIGPR